jgi:uncharacterized membrane protein YqaE (UPF0057 family)
MRWIFAIVLPPVAVFLCGKPFQAVINIALTIAGYVPGLIHALFVVNSYYNEQNTKKIVRATEQAALRTERALRARR